MADALDFYFRAAPVVDPAARAKHLVPDAAAYLDGLADAVEGMEEFGEAEVKTAVEAWLARTGLEIKTVAQPARVALTGRTASPGLFEVIAVLGREVSVQRLRAGAEAARAAPPPAAGGPAS
jgi:glutamyl-tRNA synthetase